MLYLSQEKFNSVLDTCNKFLSSTFHKIEYLGYTVSQSLSDNHVYISRNGKLVFHSESNERKTDDELRAMVRNFLNFEVATDYCYLFKQYRRGGNYNE